MTSNLCANLAPSNQSRPGLPGPSRRVNMEFKPRNNTVGCELELPHTKACNEPNLKATWSYPEIVQPLPFIGLSKTSRRNHPPN